MAFVEFNYNCPHCGKENILKRNDSAGLLSLKCSTCKKNIAVEYNVPKKNNQFQKYLYS